MSSSIHAIPVDWAFPAGKYKTFQSSCPFPIFVLGCTSAKPNHEKADFPLAGCLVLLNIQYSVQPGVFERGYFLALCPESFDASQAWAGNKDWPQPTV